MATKINYKAIDEIIQRNIQAFAKRGVMTVRPGYKMTGGWITDKPAIVATVDKKLDGLTPSDRLPAEVEDVPVDVREATGLQRLRAQDPMAHALAVAHGRNEFKEPDWKFERNVGDGRLVSAAPKLQHASLTQISKKPEIDYTPAAPPLAPVTRKMTIVAHASPDDGFPVLTNFLSETQSHLTIAMYDFTSGDLLKAVESAIKPGGGRPFEMVLDHPPRNPTANQTDDQTRDGLLGADTNAAVNWALTRNDPKTTEWVFPTAYHIKVAVRDSTAFWLSSGNFNVSNQPNLKAKDPKKGSLKNADRDWHVIVMDEGLAQLYEAYIQHDFTVAAAGQGTGDPAQHAQIHKAMVNLQTEQKKSSLTAHTAATPSKASTLGNHKVFTDVPVTVQPLLTPDKDSSGKTLYVEQVLALIQSAKRSVYMQTQYVHPSDKPADADFMLLVAALSDAHKKGLDVRLITSQFENTAQWVEKMKEFDLDQVLRIQERVHNKGIVVDSETVMVSSQNWSADGTLRNRDAGLIIANPDIAKYFEAIFLFDWVHQATEKLVDASRPATKGGAAKKNAGRKTAETKAPSKPKKR